MLLNIRTNIVKNAIEKKLNDLKDALDIGRAMHPKCLHFIEQDEIKYLENTLKYIDVSFQYYQVDSTELNRFGLK